MLTVWSPSEKKSGHRQSKAKRCPRDLQRYYILSCSMMFLKTRIPGLLLHGGGGAECKPDSTHINFCSYWSSKRPPFAGKPGVGRWGESILSVRKTVLVCTYLSFSTWAVCLIWRIGSARAQDQSSWTSWTVAR